MRDHGSRRGAGEWTGLPGQPSPALGRMEVWLRALAEWGMRVWKSSRMPVRILLVLAGLALAAGAALVSYCLVFAG